MALEKHVQYPAAPLSGSQEIRLLELLPGLTDELMKCNLLPYTMGSPDVHIPYEAISYEWGRPGPHSIIELNGQEFQIQANLFAFLKILRSGTEGQTRVLWADAICINQKDIPERNQQVRIMRKIFRQAERVLSWLGPAADGSDAALDICSWLQNVSFDESLFAKYNKSEEGLALQGQMTGRGEVCRGQQSSLDEYYALEARKREWQRLTKACYDALIALQKRSYWGRIWIVPEVALGKEVLVHCGRKCVTFDAICQSTDFLRRQWQPFVTNITGLEMAPKTFEELRNYRSIGFSGSLHELLEGFGHSQCTVLHDRVYALLGTNTRFR